MPKKADAADLLPDVRFAYEEVKAKAKARGITVGIADYGGVRTEADTAAILRFRDDDWNAARRRYPRIANTTTKEAWRPIAPRGSSFHDYGGAVDVQVLASPPGLSRLAALNIVLDLFEAEGMRTRFIPNDPAHVQRKGSLSETRAEWEKLHPPSKGAAQQGVLFTLAIVAALFVAILSLIS